MKLSIVILIVLFSKITLAQTVNIEIQPEFKKGEQALYEYLEQETEYPKDAFEAKIEGKVYVRFVVGKTGKISDVTVIKKLYPSLDEEAIRVVGSMSRWRPGKQAGKRIPVAYTLPIKFIL